MKIVEVQWLDTVFEDTCQHISEARKTQSVPRTNIGYLLSPDGDTAANVVIAFGIVRKGEETFCDGVMAIPVGMVISVKELEE